MANDDWTIPRYLVLLSKSPQSAGVRCCLGAAMRTAPVRRLVLRTLSALGRPRNKIPGDIVMGDGS